MTKERSEGTQSCLSAALLCVEYCGWPQRAGKAVMESCIYNMGFMFSFTYEWYSKTDGYGYIFQHVYFLCPSLTTNLYNEKD